jgi:NAD(P)-dependent dehydrogenase (short-subunit alcohol dehydrogenase family)
VETLKGRVAVVTGAASGIGLGMAEQFARAGMSVVMADIEGPALRAAATTVEQHGADVLARVTDVSDLTSMQTLARETADRFGAVHVVCNNAGVGGGGDAWRGPIAAWHWVVGVNLMGVVHGVHAFLPLLEAQGEGHIVNTASMAGVGRGALGAYGATKHAVVALSEDLYLDQVARQTGVGVSVLCPGWVRTRIIESRRNWPARLGPAPPDPEGSEEIRAIVDQLIAEGMPPAAVADLVIDAVKAGRFWIFPHPEMLDAVLDWTHSMVAQQNPDLWTYPGMGLGIE